MPAQTHDHDPVQRRVGLAVTTAVEAMPDGLARGRLDRRGAAQHANAASERSRSGLSPAATSSAPAMSGPTPNTSTRPGAALADQPVQLGLSSVADLAVQGLVAAGEGAKRELAAAMVGVPGCPAGTPPSRDQLPGGRPRSCWRSGSGAVTTKDLSALIVWVRARWRSAGNPKRAEHLHAPCRPWAARSPRRPAPRGRRPRRRPGRTCRGGGGRPVGPVDLSTTLPAAGGSGPARRRSSRCPRSRTPRPRPAREPRRAARRSRRGWSPR